ncbi:MAG TPA: translation initiation factor IF-2 [Thermoanaerobaculia bacterium]|nr:translation initiation factor IF-2 [Thermoanaerobaculia bacterium]
MAKVRVGDLAKQMGIPDKDLIFKLQSLGVQVESASASIEPEVIMAILQGKKLATRPRNVIMRDEKPQPEAQRREVKPPRPIVKSAAKKTEPASVETVAAPATPVPIITEFIEAAEAEAAEQERAAREPKVEPPPIAAAPPEVEKPRPHAPQAPIPPPAERRPSGPTGPRAQTSGAPRPNYQGQGQQPYRPAGGPGGSGSNAPYQRSASGAPSGAPSRPGFSRPSGPGSAPGRPPMGGAPRGASGPGMRPSGGPGFNRGPGAPPPMSPMGAGPQGIRRKKETELLDERPEKKKPTGKRVKRTSQPEDDINVFTKGPFSANSVLNEDSLPDLTAEGSEDEEAQKATSRKDARKQAAPVSAKVLVFKRPEGKVSLSEGVTVKELADKLGVKANDLMKHLLMKKGLMVSINAPLGSELALEIAKDLEIDAELVSFEEAVEIESIERAAAGTGTTGSIPRGPVITVMGHVDHGKTSLLDAIRETNVAAGEAGGITQHIGAYHVDKRGRKIVFLDTPGHEAFTMMRARGAKITDIVVLVVAADDGVMPQTKEAIDHARAAKVPMIVAINKVDKPNANVERVRQELSTANVLVEQWGGDVVSQEVSAVKKQGIDELLDMILLTADLLELKSNPDMSARGVVLEARKDVGRGIVATILVQDGTLRIGDAFFSGTTSGRIRAMVDEHGVRVKEAGPSTPVSVTGFDDMPKAGDTVQAVDEESRARMIGSMRQEKAREQLSSKGSRMSLDQLFEKMKSGHMKEINLIVKADVQGSVEVLTDTLRKLSQEQVKVNVLHASAGAISTNDILLASASNAIVIGFNVRPERSATELADKEGVDIRLHTVIYQLTDEIRQAMTGVLDPKFQEAFQGRAEVRALFKVPKMGTIAGCHVLDGVIPRASTVRLIRDGRVVFEGKIGSLRHLKNDVSEVRSGFDCGIGIERFQDYKVNDVIEAFRVDQLAGVLQ